VLENLGKGVDFGPGVVISSTRDDFEATLKIAFFRKLMFSQQEMMRLGNWNSVFHQYLKAPFEDPEKNEALELLQTLLKAAPDKLRQAVKDDDPQVRYVAIQVIAKRRLHLEKELIGRLSDPVWPVREAARHALVRLARGADFGPARSAGWYAQRQAVRRWQQWLAMQKEDNLAFTSFAPEAHEAETLRLTTELLQAGTKQLPDLLAKLKVQEGDAATMALAAGAAEFKGDKQLQVRKALVDRLAAMPPDKLRDYLWDEDQVLRQAGALACAVTRRRDLIPDLLKRLEDPEAAVVQAMRAALRELTGQDFGPAPNAEPLDHFIAIGNWYRWWTEKKAAEK